MGLYFRRRTRLTRRSWLNWSRSGVSVSHRRGPVTVNSRGRVTVRLARGLGWRFGK